MLHMLGKPLVHQTIRLPPVLRLPATSALPTTHAILLSSFSMMSGHAQHELFHWEKLADK